MSKNKNEIIDILNIAMNLLEGNEVSDEIFDIIKQLEDEWEGQFEDIF